MKFKRYLAEQRKIDTLRDRSRYIISAMVEHLMVEMGKEDRDERAIDYLRERISIHEEKLEELYQHELSLIDAYLMSNDVHILDGVMADLDISIDRRLDEKEMGIGLPYPRSLDNED